MYRVNILNSNILEEKKISMIYADFDSILVPEDNREHLKIIESKIQIRLILTNIKNMLLLVMVTIVHVDYEFSKPFKPYLGIDAVYNFINSMFGESKDCSDVMKNYFNKELVMTKKDNEDFENSTKFWICDSTYVDGDSK